MTDSLGNSPPVFEPDPFTTYSHSDLSMTPIDKPTYLDSLPKDLKTVDLSTNFGTGDPSFSFTCDDWSTDNMGLSLEKTFDFVVDANNYFLA